MKLLAKLSTLGVAAFCTAAFASATTLQFGSYSTADPVNAFGNQNTPVVFVPSASTTGVNVPNSSNTIDLNSGPAGNPWHTALPNSAWVSWGQTGPTTPPNFAPDGTFVFQSSFTLPSQATAFSFTVLADDTVNVYLDGQTGNALTVFAPGANHICQDLLPNCETPDTVTSAQFPQILSLLTAGNHTVTFVVLNNHEIDMGLDFTATVTTADLTGNPIPEPSSLLLLGTGLVGSAGLMMRKLRVRA